MVKGLEEKRKEAGDLEQDTKTRINDEKVKKEIDMKTHSEGEKEVLKV